MTRKLVSIRRIHDLQPIPDADRIELAFVDGWQVVVKKREHHVGEFVVYFEIDSWVPNCLAPFLTKGATPHEFNGVPGERLRTVKLKKQLSQGLILPLLDCNLGNETYYENDDLTEVLNVQLYEKPLPAQLAGVAKGNFPSFLRKTDQERVQNIDLLMYDNYTWEVTEKLDGSSMTAYIINKEDRYIFGVCSRNIDLIETEGNAFWKAVRNDNLEALMQRFGGSFAIQGELIGEGIQGNPYKLVGHKFYVFDIFDIDTQTYLQPTECIAITFTMGLNHVPVLYTHADTPPNKQHALELAEGKSYVTPEVEAEGIVFKSTKDSESFKAISNKWLLNEK
jgi:RNA ligase (TIGR02306 family)